MLQCYMLRVFIKKKNKESRCGVRKHVFGSFFVTLNPDNSEGDSLSGFQIPRKSRISLRKQNQQHFTNMFFWFFKLMTKSYGCAALMY